MIHPNLGLTWDCEMALPFSTLKVTMTVSQSYLARRLLLQQYLWLATVTQPSNCNITWAAPIGPGLKFAATLILPLISQLMIICALIGEATLVEETLWRWR